MTFALILAFFTKYWKHLLIGVGIIVFIVLISSVYKSCTRSPSIDIENIEKINSQNRQERLKELEKIIVENSEVVKDIDGRNTIADINIVERNRKIDEKIKEADQKITEAKQQGRDITSQELECILLPETCS